MDAFFLLLSWMDRPLVPNNGPRTSFLPCGATFGAASRVASVAALLRLAQLQGDLLHAKRRPRPPSSRPACWHHGTNHGRPVFAPDGIRNGSDPRSFSGSNALATGAGRPRLPHPSCRGSQSNLRARRITVTTRSQHHQINQVDRTSHPVRLGLTRSRYEVIDHMDQMAAKAA